MHTDSTSRDDSLASAFALWEREPALAAALKNPGASHLVLDAQDGRVRHASPAAARLAEALRSVDGAGIARQIAACCPHEGGHRLLRLRLDPRRIVPPSLFLVSRASDARGSTVYLAVPSGPLALPRLPVPAAPAAPKPPSPSPAPLSSAPAPTPEPVVEALREGDRFLWRSDEHGVLTRISGPLSSLVGRDWRALAGSDASGTESLATALAGRATFRKLPISLRLGPNRVHADISGAPAGREGAFFTGFEGFGVVRGVARADAGLATLADDLIAFGSDEDAETGNDATLSNDEHAAFREIARALGARYAGDEADPAGHVPPERIAGSVMPFPGLRADLAPMAPEAADESGRLLDSLPMAALVHRGDTILAVNRPFLDMTRHADLASLRDVGIEAIFPGGAPNFRSGQSHETAIKTASGGARPVEVTRGICAWDGGPAAILLLRSLDENDPRRELAAERLAREVQAGRALGAEAALDALQAGVVTIDREGRVVTLNRAAATCLGGTPSELVGSAFAGLFDTGSATLLAAALAGSGETPAAVLSQGRAMTLALAPPRPDGQRVAVLHRLPDSFHNVVPPPVEARPEPAPSPAMSLRRLDRELREPVDAILSLTHAMLEERYGALGDLRYRACLSDIRDAGERIVGRMAELADLAAVEAGQIALDPHPLALNEVVATCVAQLQPEAARGRIVVRTSFSADLAELESDEPSLRRAVILVIEHAIRRSVAGGQVIVSTGPGEGAEVALRVRDGCPSKEHSATNPAEEDTRLALPRALVQANGGSLRMAGRGDEGMLVEILLPTRRGMRSGQRDKSEPLSS